MASKKAKVPLMVHHTISTVPLGNVITIKMLLLCDYVNCINKVSLFS